VVSLTELLVRMPLSRQIFLAAAAVLGAVTLVLLAAPVTLDGSPGIGEVAWTLGALGAVLLAIHLLLRRLLAPLLRLGEAMDEIDPRDPPTDLRARVLPDDRDVARLLDAFERMLERFRTERLRSDRRTAAAQEAERRLVAAEVHDQLGQTLTALSLHLQRIEMAEEDRALLRAGLDRALQDVRGIARRLRPEGLDDLGLVNALIALATTVQEQSGVPVAREIAAPLPPLEPDAELALYRIAQEAMTNAVRHADARRISLVVRARGEGVELVVADDGRGGATATAGGGIPGMRERARLTGATLELDSTPGRGTRVRCLMPPVAPA